ncbi:MAG TPA: hypothetical protein VF516_12200, partial [Kofleriaceae bacterium]
MTGKARTRSLRSLHWDESKHPRNDKGEFSRKAGANWAAKVVKQIGARFGDVGVGEGGREPQGRLQTGKGGLIDLSAITQGARSRAEARAPKKAILPKGTFERGPSSASSSHAKPTRAIGSPESTHPDAVEPGTLKPGDVFIRNGARHEVLSGPVKGKRAGLVVWRYQVRRQDGKTGPLGLTHPVQKVEPEAPKPSGARLPGGGTREAHVAETAGVTSAGRAPGGATESTDDFLSRMQAKQQAARAAGGVTTSARGEQKPSVHAVMKAAGIERPDDNNAKSAISRANDRLGRGEDPAAVAGTLREAARALELEREEVPEDDEQRFSELTQSIRSLERTAEALEGGAGPKGRAPGGGVVDTSRAKSETSGVTTSQARQEAAIKLGTSFSGNPYSKLPTLEALTDDDFKALTPEQQDNVRFLASKIADRQTGEARYRAQVLEGRFGKWGSESEQKTTFSRIVPPGGGISHEEFAARQRAKWGPGAATTQTQAADDLDGMTVVKSGRGWAVRGNEADQKATKGYLYMSTTKADAEDWARTTAAKRRAMAAGNFEEAERLDRERTAALSGGEGRLYRPQGSVARVSASAAKQRALQDSTDPRDNGAKIKALEEGTLDHADLYRTATAGPSGQRSAVKVGRVRHTPDNPSGEFRITDRDGQLAGWVSRTNRNGEIRYSATQENYDGGTELLGWADSLAHAADVLTNGETAASSSKARNSSTARISGALFERNPARGKMVEQLDQEAAQREVSRAREALKNPNLGPGMRAAHERTIAEAGKVQVYDVETGKTREVSRAEAAAGVQRHARSLGAGTPAAAVGERKAAAVATGQAGTPVKPAKPKIYEWSNVRQIPASSLEVGDEFIKPTTGSAFTSHGDGEVQGHGFQPLEGTKFTVTAREGNTITARDESGRELTQTIPGDRQPNVLRVGTEGPNARHERRIAEMRREAEAKSAALSAQDRATRDGVAPTDGRPNVSALLKMQGRNRDYDLGTSRGREKTMTPDIVRAGNGYMDDQRASAEIMNPLDGTGDYRYRIYSDATGATLEEGTGRDLADVKAKVDRIWSSQRGGGMARSKGAGPVRFEARQTERPKDLSRGDIGRGPFYDHTVVQINPDGTERIKIKTSSMSRAQEDAADLNAKESAAREAAGGGFDTTGLDERQIAGLMTIDPERRAEVAAQFRLANQGRAERAARDAAELAGINAVGMPGRGESPEAQRAKLLQLASKLEGADTSRLGNEHAAEVPGRGVNYSAYIMDGKGDRILNYSDHTGFSDPTGGRLADNEVPYYMAAYNANPGYGPQALRNQARETMRGAGVESVEFRRVPNDTRSEREQIDQELRDLKIARQVGMRSGRLDSRREARIRQLETRNEELRVEDRKANAKQFKKGDKITSRAGESEVVSINKEGYLRVQLADGKRGWVDPADAEKVSAPSAGEEFAAGTRAALGEVDPRKGGGWNLPREAPRGSKIEFTSGGNIKVPETDRQARRELEGRPPGGTTAPAASALPKTESTPAYDKLLATEGPAALQNKTMRGVVEQMEAHGWQLKSQNPMLSLTTWEAPDGRTLAIQHINTKKPTIYSSEHPNAINTRTLTFKAVLAHVVTPTPPETSPGPSVGNALRSLGLPELSRQHGMTTAPTDPYLRPLYDADRGLAPKGMYGGQGKTLAEVTAVLRRNATMQRDAAKRADELYGFGGRDMNSARREQAADTMEKVADELERLDTTHRASVAEQERVKALPPDIRPGRSALAASAAKPAARTP